MTPPPTSTRHRAKTAGVLLSSTLASAAVLATTPLGSAPAGALPPSSCVTHTAFVDKRDVAGNYWYEDEQHTKVGNSGCPHIWASADMCVFARARFYPSSGGSYPGSYQQVCGGTSSYQVATNVLPNTKYRMETATGSTFLGVWS